MKMLETAIPKIFIGTLREVQSQVGMDPGNLGFQIEDIPRQVDPFTSGWSPGLDAGTPKDQASQKAENKPSKHG